MFNVLKGTHDVILDEARQYSYVEELLTKVASLYNYKEFRTPIIESSDLFLRSVGEGSDIVRKEMYTFYDKGDRLITLRPEMTAGTIRSMVNNKLFANQDFPIKAFYVGPNFRYERPQQGRYRQFNQFGIECCGVNSPYRDAEVISLGYNALKMLGFSNLKLKINYLGDEESRSKYRDALRDYFGNKIDEMCDDCKERFNKNVLRILDCKVPHDIEIVKDAPRIRDYLSENSKKYFSSILEFLDRIGVEYELDDNLVRGLDYYTGVVFEYHYVSNLGKNYGALGGGGHYSNLINEIGGPNLEGVGLAFGIERLVSVMQDDNLFDDLKSNLDVYIMPLGEKVLESANSLANFLRLNGFSTDICLENKNMSQMFKKAERRNASFAVIIGEDELNNDCIILKNLHTKEQIQVNNEDLLDKLDELFDEEEHHHHEEN
ncbi:MAG: histidine--tRNA ligase [Mollicutes bacterium]|nr:histidine--tRNA ligase [Mollicutes bacterium]MDD7263837.1 histidine--tRNA ligase [bacterium]MDY4979158.1 histidine--tRNA ligase [Candidatus Onthovivens sp.]